MKANTKDTLGFLAGGGEMGELTRNYNWEKTSLGKPENWSLSLQTTVGIVLHSAFPMFLFWGKELLCFYNDAYRPSLGKEGKHPLIGKGGQEAWPDIWDFIGPLIEKVMSTGEAVWFEDQFLPIYRNGKMEDVYWTFSYSPAYGDYGQVEGVFVTCTETTGKIIALNELKESESKFRALVEEAPVATCLFTGRDMKVEIINDIMVGYWGKGHTVLGKPLVEALPELKDQPFLQLLDDVYTSGKSYEAKGALVELEVNGIKGDYYYDFTYKPVRNSSGEIFGIINVSIDATERVLAQRQLENSQKQLVSYFEQSPVAIATIDKENLTFRLANPFYGELVGRKPEEIVNKPLLEALPELKGQGFDDLLRQVVETGVPYIANEVPVDLKRNGLLERIYVNLTYHPQRSLTDTVTGILVVATDVSQQVVSRQKIEQSEKHLQLLRDTVPAMIFYLDEEQRYRSYNVVFMDWFKVSASEAIGKTTREFIGEEAYAKIQPYLTRAYKGEQTRYEMYAPSRMNGERWLSIVYTPDLNKEGKVSGVIVHATDITSSKKTEISLRNSEARFRGLIDDAPIATCVFTGKEFKIELANEIMLGLWGKDRRVIGMNLKDALPNINVQPVIEILTKVYTTGQPYSESAAKRELEIDGVKKTFYFSLTYKPLFNEQGEVYGIMDMAVDVTEQILVQKRTEESDLFSKDVFYNSPVAKIVFTGNDMVVARVNENMLDIIGRDESIIGKPFMEVMPELLNTPLLERMREVFATGKTFTMPEEKIRLIRYGKQYTGYYSYIYKPLVSTSGEIYGIMSTATEITDQVIARQKVEAKEKELRDLITAAPIGICVVSGEPAFVEEVNDRFLLISGKTREQYASKPYWEVLSEVAHIFEPILNGVFKTGIKYTTEENEMVLVRDGVPERINITFEYIPVFDVDNKVSKVIVMAVEVTHQVETRKKIEEAVIIRTKELAESNLNLKRSNLELEQFAYIASHDLQEPIRKISTFTQMLEMSMKDVNEKSKDYISKIYNSTDRMTKLIRDVLAFSKIAHETDQFEKVDLTKIVETVKTDFELQIEKTKATIEISNLPMIEALPSQMSQLFGNLLSNSLKYTRPGLSPVISISASIAKKEKIAKHPSLDTGKKYYHIEFSDNGIGFEQEHAERIFRIFQRLHGKTEFEGTGIGLSICQKIVQNHLGHISAAAGKNGGALFNILLPEGHTEA